MTPSRRWLAIATPLALAATLAACATPGPSTGAADASETPHGFVEGASEHEEPQLQLLGIDAAGAVRMLDLAAADATADTAVGVGSVGAVAHVADDGRFAVATAADDADAAGLTIVDSGTWTVEHGDHAHYYRAEPRIVGTLDAVGPATIASTETATVVLADDGAVHVLDRAALGQGEVEALGTFAAPGATVATPLGDAIVVADAEGVRIVDATGDAVATTGTDPADAPTCTAATGSITTRVGVAVACAEGAVLATASAEEVTLEAIPYPEGTDPAIAAATFDARPNRATVAAVAGTQGYWLLDTRERSWTLVPTATPLARVAAVDDADELVVAVTTEGRVVAFDASGTPIGQTEPVLAASLADPVAAAALELEVDASRAYVAAVADGIVLEIDYADAARIARTLPMPGALHLAEVGR